MKSATKLGLLRKRSVKGSPLGSEIMKALKNIQLATEPAADDLDE